MIKGRYVATITLDIRIDENEPGLLPFDELREKVVNGELDKSIVAVLSDAYGNISSVGLNRQYADLYRVDGGVDNG